jgi:hypothetical protein
MAAFSLEQNTRHIDNLRYPGSGPACRSALQRRGCSQVGQGRKRPQRRERAVFGSGRCGCCRELSNDSQPNKGGIQTGYITYSQTICSIAEATSKDELRALSLARISGHTSLRAKTTIRCPGFVP